MSLIGGRITSSGAVIDILVGVGPARRRLLERLQLPVPPPVPLRAVIDTGASLSGMVGRVFRSLELSPVAQLSVLTPSNTPDTLHVCNAHSVSLYIVAEGMPRLIGHTRVMESEGWHPEREDGVEALIGRDLLARGNLDYLGTERRFDLAFRDKD